VEELSFSWDRRLGGTQNWYGHFEKNGENLFTVVFVTPLNLPVLYK